MLHTEARPCQWAMPSPRRTRGIETHNAIADDAGIGDMPPRKRTTPQTQPAFAGNQRLVPDADFLFAFSQHTITRDEWIAPIRYMAEGIGISTIRAILNKIPSSKIEAKLRKELEKKQIKVAGTVFLDPQISQAGFTGKKLPANTGADAQVKKIATAILSGQE